MAPSGVQKERMREEDMFVLAATGGVLHTPEARPLPYKPPKLSECSPLFLAVSSSPFLPWQITMVPNDELRSMCIQQRSISNSKDGQALVLSVGL